MCVCVSMSVIRRNSNLLHLQRVGRRGQTIKKKEKKLLNERKITSDLRPTFKDLLLLLLLLFTATEFSLDGSSPY